MTDRPDKQKFLEKLIAMLQETDSEASLQAIGREVLLDQLAAIADLPYSDTQNKLPAILIGLPHERFYELLAEGTALQLQNIQRLASTEPLQHHLTMMSHDLELQIREAEAAIENLGNEIEGLDIANMGQEDVASLERTIEGPANKLRALLPVCRRALTLAWNTTRLDLIEALSRSKERAESLLANAIGERRSKKGEATGLYKLLESRLFRVYMGEEIIDELKDHEPAVEGLAKFSIWHPKDYQEIGLLPQHYSCDKSKACGKAEADEALFCQISENLKNIGLETLSDLKKARIFSKKSLREFISAKGSGKQA